MILRQLSLLTAASILQGVNLVGITDQPTLTVDGVLQAEAIPIPIRALSARGVTADHGSIRRRSKRTPNDDLEREIRKGLNLIPLDLTRNSIGRIANTSLSSKAKTTMTLML